MAGSDRTNAYQDIAEAIVADLEHDYVPWPQPRDSGTGAGPVAIPCNAATHRPDSGINVLTLWSAVAQRKFTGHRWLTFRQALGLGCPTRRPLNRIARRPSTSAI